MCVSHVGVHVIVVSDVSPIFLVDINEIAHKILLYFWESFDLSIFPFFSGMRFNQFIGIVFFSRECGGIFQC